MRSGGGQSITRTVVWTAKGDADTRRGVVRRRHAALGRRCVDATPDPQEFEVADNKGDVRSALLQRLMEKVEEDPFPSITMLDTIEELLHPEDVQKYADLLLDKVANERFPSVTMISRIRGLAE
jgi:hypothetical protein